MEPYGGRGAPIEPPRRDPITGLEESMWQLALGGGGGGGGGTALPERPGEPDCTYYLRTGSCGYGERCRYNHPRDYGIQVARGSSDAAAQYPERAGQPACQYFLKTGTCKYGATCKYDHPMQGDGSVHAVSLSYFGYPLRPGEKECSYYMRTGQCKFGSTCKFHHPQPEDASVPSPPPAYYPQMQSPSVPSPHQYPTMDVTGTSMLAAPYIQGPYGPMLVSPEVVPYTGWTPYPAPVSPVVSPSGQRSTQAGPMYRSSNQLSPSAPAYQGAYPATSSTTRPSSSSKKEQKFPEKPGQPECQYYMRTGDCKFGSTCKYHHPPERSTGETNCVLSPIGLPLRLGAPHCAFYAQHGVCKFGPTCKFDHPMGTLGYNPASSFADIRLAPYPVGFSMATLAPSSSAEQRPEFISNRDAFFTRMPSSEGTSSGSTRSLFPNSGYAPHLLVQHTIPSSATNGGGNSSSMGGKISSSS